MVTMSEKVLPDAGPVEGGRASAASGEASRTSVATSASGAGGGPTTTISTIAVQSGDTRIVLALLQSAEWLELRVVELNPGLAFLGSNLEEAKALHAAHQEVLTKLQGKQSPVEDLLNQADQLIATQRPKAEVYASMAESLGLAWKDLNAHLETRKELLDLSVSFHTRARQYSDALDEAEKIYTDNVMPSEIEGVRQLLTTLQEKKRLVLEASMHTLQEANILLTRLRNLLQQGGSMDSRPYHIKTSIEFACSQIEHQLEALHDRRKFLDGLFATKKTHLEQCLSLCILYQELTDVVLSLKSLRDEISIHQGLGESQVSSEILLHEHLRREEKAKNLQDQCIRHVRNAEQMEATGHNSGTEARARSYSVLEAASALHDTCSTRISLLEQAALFFKLANTSLNKLDQAEIQVAGLDNGVGQRLSIVIGLVEEAVQPALAEGYAILEVTGGRGHSHNAGVTKMVEHLEKRRSYLSSLCEHTTEQAVQRTELINSFMEQFNSIDNWLVRIGDAFLQGHQDPGGSLSMAKDFYHLHQTLKGDINDKKQDIDALEKFLQEIEKDLPEEESETFSQKIQNLINHWANLTTTIESRILLCEIYVRFHEDAEKLQNKFENFEEVLRKPSDEFDDEFTEREWNSIQKSFSDLNSTGKEFITMAEKIDDQSLDINRALICIKSILENFGKKKLVISDLHTHFKMRISISKELNALWKTYKENLRKMDKEMHNLEESFCPLLRGDINDADGMALSLEYKLSNFIGGIKKIQEGIESMVTKAEGHAHNEDASDERSTVVRSLLQLYQNLQNKVTDYQILGTMLCQWCRNIAEIHKSCDKLEKQFVPSSLGVKNAEIQLKENGATRQTIMELLQFARNEASSIFAKLRNKCPPIPGAQDIDTMEKMMERRKSELENIWSERQINLESHLKRSHYQSDLQVISEQLHDLSEQLSNMKGKYGDSLPAALQMKTAFIQFKITVDLLEKRIQSFVSTAEKMLGSDDDSEEIRTELGELDNKWSTFQRQVGESQKNIDLSIEYFKLVQEAEDWFRQGSELLVDIAGKSSQIQGPEDAIKLRQIIDNFLHPGEDKQYQRLRSISSLAILLYGESPPEHVENVTKQNEHMIDSFTAINDSISTLVDNLRQAEHEKARQGKEQEEMAASLAAAQAEAESARLAAIEADDARKNAEEVARIMASTPQPIVTEKVEATIQTDDIMLPAEEFIEKHEIYTNEENYIEDESEHMSPMFITPLVSAVVSEGVKFTFECRLIGNPRPTVNWLKDGLSIMSNPDYKTSYSEEVCALVIEETFTEDSALFTCKGTNASGAAETSATLTVNESLPSETYSSPVFTKHLQDSGAKEGSKLDLNCTVTGHPLPVVTWTKNGIVIDSSPDYVIIFNNGDCTLRFEELFLEDTAQYSCRAFNDYGEDITEANITVTTAVTSVKPVFTVPLSNIMARAGQKFKLECQVKGSPPPTVTWFHNGKPVKETPDCKITFDGNSAMLLMSESFPKNAGVYSAVAKNTAGETQSSSNVSVKGRIPTETSDSEMTSDADAEPIKPTIQLQLKDSEIKEGDTVRLDCVIVGHPEPEVIWYHNGKPVKEAEDFKLLFHGDRCSLVIQEAYIEDGGDYKVVAMNSAGEASTACLLTVKEAIVVPPPVVIAPHFLLLLSDCHVSENNPVHLKAKVEGSPFPAITWFKDSIPLLPDTDLEITQLDDGFAGIDIPNASVDHTGQYEIVATNSAGTAKSIGFLSVEPYLPPKPSDSTEPPMFIKLLEDTETFSGESMTFEVEVSGKPKPLITWAINDYQLTGAEYLSGERQYYIEERKRGVHCLKWPSCSKVQAGTLKVTAENSAGKASSSCCLKIEDKPCIEPNEDELNTRTVISESHVTSIFSSSTVDGQPTTQSLTAQQKYHISSANDQPVKEIYETKVQKVTQEADQEPVVSEKVIIRKLEDKQTVEEFKEEVESTPSTPTRKSVRKATPARFITPLQGVIAKEDDKILLEGVFDGYPQPSVEWTHNGGPLQEDVTPSVDLNRVYLSIPVVLQSHSGRYTCVLDNPGGSAQCTCDIVVKKTQFPPVFSRRLQPVVIGVGGRLNLEVDVSGTPTPSVKWLKNGAPLHPSENLQIKSEGTRQWLTIPKANEADSGRYGVIANNAAGRAESLADVIISDLATDSSSHRIIYTEVQDDIRGEPIIEVGPIQQLENSYIVDVTASEESKEQKVESTPICEVKTEITELPKIPGKLRAEWPPLPSEEDIPLPQKIDASLEISKDKVSSGVSIFREFEAEPSAVSIPKPSPAILLKPNIDKTKVSKVEKETISNHLIPGPQPEYGYISPNIVTYNEEEILTPVIAIAEKESRNYETVDDGDAIAQNPVSAKLYGEINKVNTVANTDEMTPKLVGIKTEKEINESKTTEVETTISASEKTLVETKIFREYDDSYIQEKHPAFSSDLAAQSSNIDHEQINKDKKKRESVRQIALRLEESIAPLSAEDVPGGIRTFPSPLIQLPAEEYEEVDVEPIEPVYMTFPELEPFPFHAEDSTQGKRAKLPPPPKPKKFIPKKFSDRDMYSDSELIPIERPQLKKIKFQPSVKLVKRDLSKSTSPAPPTSFESPPKVDGMRPVVMKEPLREEVVEYPVKKEIIPRKPPKIVQTYLSKTQNKEHEPPKELNEKIHLNAKHIGILEGTEKSTLLTEQGSMVETSVTSTIAESGFMEEQPPAKIYVSTEIEKLPLTVQRKNIGMQSETEINKQYTTQSISPMSTKSNRMSWPPVRQDDENLTLNDYNWQNESGDKEMVFYQEQKLSELVTKPIYWSSNVSLTEKQELPSPGKQLSVSEYKADHTEYSSSFDKKSYTNVSDSSSKKFVNPLSTPKFLKKPLNEKASPIKQTKHVRNLPESEIQISFDLQNKLQPFPFEVPKSEQRPRKITAGPSKPKRFIPGTFAESDYESDYEGKPPSVWRPYASDTETNEYRPVKVKLRQGRTRTPRNKSPPAPSEFNIPLQMPSISSQTTEIYDVPDAKTAISTNSVQKHVINVHKTAPVAVAPSKPFPMQTKTVKKFPQSSVSKIQQKFEQDKIAYDDSNIISSKNIAPSRTYQTLPRSTKFHSSQTKHISQYEKATGSPSITTSNVIQTGPACTEVQIQSSSLNREDECGYTADTESTLPRRVKTHSESTTFCKNESFTSSSSFKSFKKEEAEFSGGVSFMGSDVLQDPQQFLQTISSPLNRTTQSSSTFASSESKASKVHSTREEELFESRCRDKKSPESKTKAPKFREFMKETTGSRLGSDPYDERAYYSMSDESEVFTDAGKTKSKIEIKTESHVSYKSDKKTEKFSTSYQSPSYKSDNESDSSYTKSKNKFSSDNQYSKTFPSSKVNIGAKKTYSLPEQHSNSQNDLEHTTTPLSKDTSKDSAFFEKATDLKSAFLVKEENHRFKQAKPANESNIKEYPLINIVTNESKLDSKNGSIHTEERPHLSQKLTDSRYISEPQHRHTNEDNYKEYAKFGNESEPKPVGVESTKSFKMSDSSPLHRRVVSMEQTTRLIKFSDPKDNLQPFPFTPEPEKAKREKLQPPPKPKKFEKNSFRESDYESDFDEHIKPKWQPPESDTEDPYYAAIKYKKYQANVPKEKERTPTPPSIFDIPPTAGEPTRPDMEEVKLALRSTNSTRGIGSDDNTMKNETVKPTLKDIYTKFPTPTMYPGSPPEEGIITENVDYIADIANVKKRSFQPDHKYIQTHVERPYHDTIEITETKITEKEMKSVSHSKTEKTDKTTITYIYDDSESELSGTSNKDRKQKGIHKTNNHKENLKQDGNIEIDIDICDSYNIQIDSDEPSIAITSNEIQQRDVNAKLPTNIRFQQNSQHLGSVVHQPKKFVKGNFRESDYESDYEGKILPKWVPSDSESDSYYMYRRVYPPRTIHPEKIENNLIKSPSPPSKFDNPPHFEGPPRPSIDMNVIPPRERRESLDEYSMAKFPKVEFKPFDIGEYANTNGELVATRKDSPSFMKPAKAFADQQFQDMTQDFRTKAHNFADQLVSEVFSGKEADNKDAANGGTTFTSSDLDGAQTYRDHSRASEFGTKHIDPDTGLIYFKYDFGYEFGIVLPGEKKQTGKPLGYKGKKENGEIEIPVIHLPSDDEFHSSKSQESKDRMNNWKGKQYEDKEYYKQLMFLKPLTNKRATEEDKIVLECVVRAESPLKVFWTKNGNPIDNGERRMLYFNNGVCRMVIQPVEKGDAGIYQCTIENLYGKQNSSCELTIEPGMTR